MLTSVYIAVFVVNITISTPLQDILFTAEPFIQYLYNHSLHISATIKKGHVYHNFVTKLGVSIHLRLQHSYGLVKLCNTQYTIKHYNERKCKKIPLTIVST